MDATFQKALGESLASLATRYENQGLSDRAAGVRDSIDVLAVICPKAAKAAKYYFQGDELREARNWDETPDTTERPPVDEAYEELQSCGN